jgi:hypothetical protein
MFNDGVQHGHRLLCKLHIEDGSAFKNFIWMMENNLQVFLQKIGPRIQRKVQNIVVTVYTNY